MAKRSNSSQIAVLLLITILLPNFASSQILFQGFNWESWKKDGGWYNWLKTLVDDVAASGATHVWLPPPSQSIAEQGSSHLMRLEKLVASSGTTTVVIQIGLALLTTK